MAETPVNLIYELDDSNQLGGSWNRILLLYFLLNDDINYAELILGLKKEDLDNFRTQIDECINNLLAISKEKKGV